MLRFSRAMISAVGALALAAPIAAQQREYSVSGAASVKSVGLYNPYTLLVRKDVQRVADEALKGPISADRLASLLAGSEVTADHLTATDVLIRRPDGSYQLGMTVFTAEDRVLLDRVADNLGQSLAQAVVARRKDFDRILGRYDLQGVDPAMVRMALIGCLMLDWDGLRVTAENDFRTAAVKKPSGDEYQMVLRERTPLASARALYWGSHNAPAAGGAIKMSTFGDHHPGSARAAFPDLTWIVEERDFGRVARAPLAPELAKAFAAEMQSTQDVTALIMRRLRGGAANEAVLAQAAGQPVERVRRTLQLLAALNYVSLSNGEYQAAIPVFTEERDGAMIREFRALGREVMLDWLRKNYATSERQLSGLTALRAGVPFKVMYTEVWHPIFGWANYHLVRDGYLHDPYGPKARFISFVPFVWDASLRLDFFS